MRHALATLLVFALTACGFAPVYSADGAAGAGTIEVAEIPGRSGHILRRDLIRELSIGLPDVSEGKMRVELRERLSRVPVRIDGGAARTDIITSARYVLDTGDDALSGSVVAESSFNVPDAAFADISAQNIARERAMRTLAGRIVDDLRLKLSSGE